MLEPEQGQRNDELPEMQGGTSMSAPAQIPFAIVPLNVSMSTVLTRTEKAVWTALASHAEGPLGPYARPSVETISWIAGCCERTAQRALRNLESLGAIACYRERFGCCTEYWLNFSFGLDEEDFTELMRRRAERNADPLAGLRGMELDEQLELELGQVELAEQPTGGDIQVSPPPDIQVSPEETTGIPVPHPPYPNVDGPPDGEVAYPVTLVGGGVSLSLSLLDLDDVECCIAEACPVFDGLCGRPAASEIMEQAFHVPWLGKRFKMTLGGLRAHCVSYARIEAKRHWSDVTKEKAAFAVVTRNEGQNFSAKGAEDKDRKAELLPAGFDMSSLPRWVSS